MGTRRNLLSNRLQRAAQLSEDVIASLEDSDTPLATSCLKAHRLALLMQDEVESLVIKGLIYGVQGDTREVRQIGSFSNEIRSRASKISISLLSIPDTRRITHDLVHQAWGAESPGNIPPDTMVAAAAISELEILGPEPVHPGYTVTPDEFLHYVREHTAFTSRRKLLGRVRSWLHEYATRVNIRVQFADVVSGILESYRAAVDSRLADICPEALDMLSTAYQRLPGASPEERSQAITTLRRVLKAFADAVYPARPSWKGERRLDDQQYINRLWAWAEENIASKSNRQLVQAHIDNVGAWIDAVYRLQDKGVHATVSQREAQRLLLHTYLLLGDLIRLGDRDMTLTPA
jgi:hypothetical protein